MKNKSFWYYAVFKAKIFCLFSSFRENFIKKYQNVTELFMPWFVSDFQI
jgi:hypothetical protein